MGSSTGRGARRRPSALGVLAVSVLLLATACQPRTATQGRHRWGAITPDGTDRYTFTDDPTGFSVVAPPSNAGNNLRLAVVRTDARASIDQRACATWNGPSSGVIQPGVVLRARIDAHRTRAIMVSDGIYVGVRTIFNVHLADSTAAEPFRKVGVVSLPYSVGQNPFHQAPLPWRICARVVGTEVTVKAWPIAAYRGEPRWGDPVTSGTVAVPSDWVYRGLAGVYVGHLEPGQQTRFSDVATARVSAATVVAEGAGPAPRLQLWLRGWALLRRRGNN